MWTGEGTIFILHMTCLPERARHNCPLVGSRNPQPGKACLRTIIVGADRPVEKDVDDPVQKTNQRPWWHRLPLLERNLPLCHDLVTKYCPKTPY